jgi:fatty acid-binding protein DegV
LSGTLQSGETAANRADPQRARAIDSGHGTCGQGLLAIAAAEAAARGMHAADVAAHVQRLRGSTDTFAIARDIAYAVRGGRIPRWALPVVQGLRLTPIARRFSDYSARRLPQGRRWRVLVGHCDCAADGETLLAALMQRLDVAEGWVVEAGPAIGAHAGPGALVVGTQPVE